MRKAHVMAVFTLGDHPKRDYERDREKHRETRKERVKERGRDGGKREKRVM